MQVIVLEKKRKRGREVTLGLGLNPAQRGGQGGRGSGPASAFLRLAGAAGPRPSDQGAGARVHGCTAGSVVRWLGLRGPGPPSLSSSLVHGGSGAARKLSLPPLPCSPSPTTPMGSAMLRRRSGAFFPLCSSTLSGTSTSVPSAELVWRHSSSPCRP